MLLIAVLLVAFATNVHGQLQLNYRENGKLCSQWISTLFSDTTTISYISNSLCTGKVAIEEDWYQLRICCPTTGTVTVAPTAATTKPTTALPGTFPRECGKQKYQPSKNRIVGGGEAHPNSWPWQVRIDGDGALCGGTLVDTRHVVTAAHCISTPTYTSRHVVYVGTHEINKPVTSEQRIVAERIFVHEQYNTYTKENDIAVIRLSKPVTISDKVNVICLPGAEATKSGETVWLVGWGTTTFQGRTSPVLKQTSVHTMPDRCGRIYGSYSNVRQMCAGTAAGGRDSCQGDSGGPLMYESNGQWYLNGVVSYGNGCGQPGIPGVYARVSYYLPWIRSKMSSA